MFSVSVILSEHRKCENREYSNVELIIRLLGTTSFHIKTSTGLQLSQVTFRLYLYSVGRSITWISRCVVGEESCERNKRKARKDIMTDTVSFEKTRGHFIFFM